MRSRATFAVAIAVWVCTTCLSGQVSAQGVVESATGSANWTIELPNPFGVVVGNRELSFSVQRLSNATIVGRFEYQQVVEGVTYKFNVRATCMHIYDGNRAKIGGVVEYSNDPTIPVGSFAWFQVFDNGEGAGAPPDRSSLVGFGDEAANEAFCNSPNLPRFGPWDVQGNIQVHAN